MSADPMHPRCARTRLRASPVSEFLSTETFGGIVLLVAVVAAIGWANVAPASYATFWSRHVTIGVGAFEITESLGQWVTEGLMTVFFFVVGLEIKRELVRGELRDPRRAALPVLAALGGMAVPAALFVTVNLGTTTVHGWGIPIATDIAFAMAVLAVFGSRLPRPLKVFLLTLAIVDDVGSIVVIAIFYSHGVSGVWLLAAALVVGGIVAMRRLGAARPIWYLMPGAMLWYCCLEAGIHPTIAGVALGLLAPSGEVRGRPVLEQLEHRLHPWSSALIVPLFALASAGVVFDAESLRHAAGSPVTWGVVAGLVVGKPLGVFVASVVAIKLKLGGIPSGVRLPHLLGAGALAGIGFTVSLFVADLAFRGAPLRDAKLGILVASVASATVGAALLTANAKRLGSTFAPEPSAGTPRRRTPSHRYCSPAKETLRSARDGPYSAGVAVGERGPRCHREGRTVGGPSGDNRAAARCGTARARGPDRRRRDRVGRGRVVPRGDTTHVRSRSDELDGRTKTTGDQADDARSRRSLRPSTAVPRRALEQLDVTVACRRSSLVWIDHQRSRAIETTTAGTAGTTTTNSAAYDDQVITVRLHGNDEDRARKLNRTENLRPIPPGDPDFERLFPRRNDAESINRHLDDTMWLGRAHSIGHARQHLNLLGFAFTVNSLALYRHRETRSNAARCVTLARTGNR